MLDTSIMVAAIRSSTGASRRLLVGALRRRYTMLLSVPLVIEYEAAMSRGTHLATARLTTIDVQTLLDAVVRVAKPVQSAFLWRPTLRDANDDMVLEVAANGQADMLVTFNLRDFEPARTQFGIDVCAPGDAILRLEERHEKK